LYHTKYSAQKGIQKIWTKVQMQVRRDATKGASNGGVAATKALADRLWTVRTPNSLTFLHFKLRQ